MAKISRASPYQGLEVTIMENVVDRWNELCRAHRAEVDAKRARRVEQDKLEAQLSELVRRFKTKRPKKSRK